MIWLLQCLCSVRVGTGKGQEWLFYWYLPVYLKPLSLPVPLCTGDSCLKPVNSRCELQGSLCGFTSAEFGFVINHDCQIPLQTNGNEAISKECFRLTERMVGCLFSKKDLPKSAKKVNLDTSCHHMWAFETRGLHPS